MDQRAYSFDPRIHAERTALVCSMQAGHSLTLAGATVHLDVLGELPTTATGNVAKSAVRALAAGAPVELAS